MERSQENSDAMFYEIAMKQLRSGNVDNALMIKAVTKSKGDEKSGEALYLEWKVSSIKDDELFYEIAIGELRSGNVDNELIDQAIAASKGDKKEAELLYIQWRANVLKEEEQVRQEARDQKIKKASKETLSFFVELMKAFAIFILIIIIAGAVILLLQ